MCSWKLRYYSLFAYICYVLCMTPPRHTQEPFPCTGREISQHTGVTGPMVCSSHPDRAGQMLCTDFFCHPGTGSTVSRPNPTSLNSAARAQQHYTHCSWLAEGGPEDISSAKAKRSLC